MNGSPDQYLGSLLGGALGDALGRPTEFRSEPNAGLRADEIDLPNPALVTDDTQMSLAVARALAQAEDVDSTRPALITEFLRWLNSGDLAGRAAGNTCLDALRLLEASQRPLAAAENSSKGCGGVMRAHPVAFLPDSRDRAKVAAEQSLITHGHPTASLAAVVWTEVVARAVAGAGPLGWLDVAHAMVESSPEGVARLEMAQALATTEMALWVPGDEVDPCSITGPGWVAEEAVAAALAIAVRYAADPVVALERAARTSGDSDTIASMVGALLGAHLGAGAWPSEWVERLEAPYLAEIRRARPPALWSR